VEEGREEGEGERKGRERGRRGRKEGAGERKGRGGGVTKAAICIRNLEFYLRYQRTVHSFSSLCHLLMASAKWFGS